jgi:hypothetical protein
MEIMKIKIKITDMKNQVEEFNCICELAEKKV